MNNPLSYSSLKLDVFSKDGVQLKSASGFAVEAGNQRYLITNRHVVSSGPQEPVSEPYILKTSLRIHGGMGEAIRRQRITFQLYDDNKTPRWIEHRENEQDQPRVDVVALPIQSNLMNVDKFLGTIAGMPIDNDKNIWLKVSAIPVSAIDTDIEYGPSDTV